MSTATDVIQAISALLAAVGIVFGVLKWIYVQQWQNAVECVGKTAVEERKMGYFTVRWWSINPWSRRVIPAPDLPTISTLIKAGDIVSFTSSMIDWAPQVNEEVSWRRLYETFFQELAWGSVASKQEYPKSIQHALKKAHETVGALKKEQSSKVPSQTCDRHLLYSGIFARQYLRKCVLDLPTPKGYSPPPSSDPFLGYNRSWHENIREVWIWKGTPCIQVSSTELLALVFILGMPLRLKEDQNKNPVALEGTGVFGTYLTGEYGELNGPWCLRLVHWRRESPNQDPSKGNGFATQFAICIACGCLPFGQSIGLTHVVHITEKTFEGIMKGQKIADQAAIEGDLSTGERRATASCLSILPSANRKNYYRIYESKHGIPGLVYDSSLNKISTWPEVVARIAFGGLVPMAALNLVKAVRFTAQGFRKLSNDEFSSVTSMLRKLILRVQERSPNMRLFGQFIEDYAIMRKGTKRLLETFEDPVKVDKREAAAMFARHTTLLEYLTASAVNHSSKQKQDAVFDACCDELRRSYTDALAGQHQGPTIPRTECKSVEDQVKQILNTEIITTRTCGQIARFVILVWTYYVSIVVWDDKENTECREHVLRGADDSRIYYTYSHDWNINAFPESSILC